MGEARGEPARDITHARADCRERIGADRDGLAGWLGVSSGRLAALAIQQRPDPKAPTFADDVRELADRYDADVGRLADALG